ncbi:MAG: glycosyltransferase family 4 protein [Verrucomicrobiae bacterium]|nr:glycosyltransferase family 4 protein [Verrucomicrobiae bacterium]
MKPLHILHTESSIHMGGQELRIIQETGWLNAHGHRAWIAARADSAIYRMAGDRGVPVIDMPFRGSFNLRGLFKLVRFCAHEKIDVIDCHSSRDASAVALARPFMKTRVVRSTHICKRLKDDFFRRLIWKHGAHGHIATSQSIRRRLIDQGLALPSQITVVGESVNQEIFHRGVSPGTVRADFGIPTGARVVSLVGMIRSNKGQQYLVQAADRVLEQCPDVWFMLVGGATEQKYVDSLNDHLSRVRHRDRIILTGFQREVEKFIAASDVICLPSETEAQSKIIPEAFAMGKPVVASRVGGIPDIVTDGENGLLCPVGDVGAIAAALVRVLTTDVSAMVEKAHALALREMNFDRLMEKTVAVYRRIRGEP